MSMAKHANTYLHTGTSLLILSTSICGYKYVQEQNCKGITHPAPSLPKYRSYYTWCRQSPDCIKLSRLSLSRKRWIFMSSRKFIKFKMSLHFSLYLSLASNFLFEYFTLKISSAVGQAIASDIRDTRFECSPWQILATINCIEKMYENTRGLEWYFSCRHEPISPIGANP